VWTRELCQRAEVGEGKNKETLDVRLGELPLSGKSSKVGEKRQEGLMVGDGTAQGGRSGRIRAIKVPRGKQDTETCTQVFCILQLPSSKLQDGGQDRLLLAFRPAAYSLQYHQIT